MMDDGSGGRGESCGGVAVRRGESLGVGRVVFE